MNDELRELLGDLNASIKQLNKGEQVKAAATTPVDPEIESKAVTSAKQDEEFVDPLRKSFERLAIAAPSHLGYLGAKTVLEDPYRLIRAKNADGSYVVKDKDLDTIIKGMLAINGEGKEAIENGATPFNEWITKSGTPVDAAQATFEQAYRSKAFGDFTGEVRKAVDTSTGAVLIRTDIEPVLREAFVRRFPAYDLFPKIPANGKVHTFDQISAHGGGGIVAELGDVSATAANGNYAQNQSTNIAVFASQREIGLKAMWASQQSGMNFLNSNGQPETMLALKGIANAVQGQIFQGNQNASASSATADDEDGLYNVNGFTGLRQQLKHSDYSINKSTDPFLKVLRRAVGQLLEAGADMNEVMIFLSIGANNGLDEELETFYQFLKAEAGQPTPTNYSSAGLTMLKGILARMYPVPAQGTQTNGIGYYTLSSVATEDMYVLDPNGVVLPYLGSPNPTILEMPVGWGNHLSKTFIPFLMIGLAVYVKAFTKKIRLAKTTI